MSRRLVTVCVLIVVIGLGIAGRVYYRARREAKRWRQTQRAGGVPRFWESDEATTRTLMNPPGSRQHASADNGHPQTKSIEGNGFAEDQDVPARKEVDQRVFCVGDSVTYGMQQNDECFPDILEGLLASTTQTWQVVNAGRGGESTYTALLRHKYIVSEFDADAVVVGWFAGNEPIEMTREGVYTGPRIRKRGGGWDVLWEDDNLLQHVAREDVERDLQPLAGYFLEHRQPVGRPQDDSMAYIKEGMENAGNLSRRYALYGGTGFIAAFHFLRYEPGDENELREELEKLVIRSLAVAREFKARTDNRLVYLLIPEAYEVDPGFVTGHPEYPGLREALVLDEQDLAAAAFIRTWFADLLRREGIRVADPLPHMEAAAAIEPVFRRDDLHPTVAGNRAIAAALSAVFCFSTNDPTE